MPIIKVIYNSLYFEFFEWFPFIEGFSLLARFCYRRIKGLYVTYKSVFSKYFYSRGIILLPKSILNQNRGQNINSNINKNVASIDMFSIK